MVPERPRISRPANTEKVTAGSVGAIAAPISPAVIQDMPSEIMRGERDESPGDECPDDAERENGLRRAAKARQPDVESAVEEDDDESDYPDPLDRLDGQRVAKRVGRRREQTRRDEEERGVGKRDPVGKPHAEHGEEDARRDEEDNSAEVGDLSHGTKVESTMRLGPWRDLQSPYTVLMLDSR